MENEGVFTCQKKKRRRPATDIWSEVEAFATAIEKQNVSQQQLALRFFFFSKAAAQLLFLKQNGLEY